MTPINNFQTKALVSYDYNPVRWLVMQNFRRAPFNVELSYGITEAQHNQLKLNLLPACLHPEDSVVTPTFYWFRDKDLNELWTYLKTKQLIYTLLISTLSSALTALGTTAAAMTFA